jgi:recombination protein RecR
MVRDLPSLAQLLKVLQQVPYLASKYMYRVATHFLVMDNQRLEFFCQALLEAKQNIMLCATCFFWQERGAACIFCSAAGRDQGLVCVVETWQELMAIEKTGGYKGVYHVLGGVICPLEGIGPEQLTLQPLIARVTAGGVHELILATNQTPEGEATAAFIATKLKGVEVKITCLARGVPVGSSLEFMDRLTVYKALSERRLF